VSADIRAQTAHGTREVARGQAARQQHAPVLRAVGLCGQFLASIAPCILVNKDPFHHILKLSRTLATPSFAVPGPLLKGRAKPLGFISLQ
jgi:hypothetical protein